MTKTQGWVVIALLSIVVLNVLFLDYLTFNALRGMGEAFGSVPSTIELPTDYPTELPCDVDPNQEKCNN